MEGNLTQKERRRFVSKQSSGDNRTKRCYFLMLWCFRACDGLVKSVDYTQKLT